MHISVYPSNQQYATKQQGLYHHSLHFLSMVVFCYVMRINVLQIIVGVSLEMEQSGWLGSLKVRFKKKR